MVIAGRTVVARRTLCRASEGGDGDNFGYVVAIDGDLILTGGRYHDEGGLSNGGAGYVFHNDGGDDWQQEAKLLASDRAANDNFGLWLDIKGGTAVVGATYGKRPVKYT